MNQIAVLMLIAAVAGPTIERNDFLRMIPTVDVFRIDIEHQLIKIDMPPRKERR